VVTYLASSRPFFVYEDRDLRRLARLRQLPQLMVIFDSCDNLNSFVELWQLVSAVSCMFMNFQRMQNLQWTGTRAKHPEEEESTSADFPIYTVLVGCSLENIFRVLATFKV
jgi:hypothetical protein